MTPLPVIVGFGGVNAAGRLSCNHGYRRLVINALPEAARRVTYRSLAALMNLQADPDAPETQRHIENHSLIRRIESFDPDAIRWNREVRLKPGDGALKFVLNKRHLPDRLPSGWRVAERNDREVEILAQEGFQALLPDQRISKVSSAGELPTGFDPGTLYPSRSHPRGLQMAVFAASDALRSSGLSLDFLKSKVGPDQFAVYSGSALGQLDPEAYSGMLQNPLLGKRPTSKHGAFGLPEMPGDFINAYVLGLTGGTAGIIGACATFLYTLKQGVDEIRSGARRVVMAGNAEAPILPDLIEAFRVMGALAEDAALMELDGSAQLDYRRACRPFSSNVGFTAGEGAVYALLMDDALALELGANILGAAPAVYVNADGYKKSIPGPGVGNYLTLAKALAAGRSLLGPELLRRGTHVQAHGTGTPQNRVTESRILNELAKTFGIQRWPVSAAKAYVGHTMAPAGGDQLASVLGIWQDGWIPGLTTIDHIAEDVHDSHLHLPLQHLAIDPAALPGALINSKGFGGNNASSFLLSPMHTEKMLAKRWGKAAFQAYRRRNEAVRQARAAYDEAMLKQTLPSIYRFGQGVLEGEDLNITDQAIGIPGFALPLRLDLDNPWADMLDP